MNQSPAPVRTGRASRRGVVILVGVAAAAIGIILYLSAPRPVDGPASAPAFGDLLPHGSGGMLPDAGRAATEADGVLPYGVTLFEDDYAGVANLDPDLLRALRAAAADAGIEFYVASGWRSPAYQNQLLREAVADYGSAEEAARWVATAETSSHVSGAAVDIGPYDATAWLSRYGAAHGLCQIYGNESWHFELRAEAAATGCPPMYDDPTRDPRMQR